MRVPAPLAIGAVIGLRARPLSSRGGFTVEAVPAMVDPHERVVNFACPVPGKFDGLASRPP
jgi:hypothetical protein